MGREGKGRKGWERVKEGKRMEKGEEGKELEGKGGEE